MLDSRLFESDILVFEIFKKKLTINFSFKKSFDHLIFLSTKL